MVIGADDLVLSQLGELERAALARRATYTVAIGIGDRSAVVHFDQLQSAKLLELRYRDLPARGGPEIHVYAAHDDAGNPHFWTAGGAGYSWPQGPVRPAVVAFFADGITQHALLRAIPSAVTLHAAALKYAGVAFAITGHSTAGKSTTAVACVDAGGELYSDERCIITPAGTLAFPRAVNLRSGGIDVLLADLAPSPLRSRLEAHCGRDWENANFADVFAPREPPTIAPLRAIFVIGGREGRPRSRRLSAPEMLPFAQMGAITAATGIDRACAILCVLQKVACYEIMLGTPSASARHIFEVVAGALAA
jgi:hypothetical protein